VAASEVAEAARERFAGSVGIDRGDDRARSGQRGKESVEKLDLRAAGMPRRAQIPRGDGALGMKLVVAQGVDRALGDDKSTIIRSLNALPRGLAAAGGKAREATVFDLEAGNDSVVVAVCKEDVLAWPDSPGVREACVRQGLGADAALVEVGAIVRS
jgi:hypothetical protein